MIEVKLEEIVKLKLDNRSLEGK